MNTSIKDKYLIWTAIGLVVCLISLGVTIVVGSDFGHDNFVRVITFVCCNALGWLFYLIFQSFIYDAYQIYTIKFGSKATPCEEVVPIEHTSSAVVNDSPSIQTTEPTQVPEPIQIHIDAQQHEETRANYMDREKLEEEKRIRMVMEYIHYIMPRIADEETVNHICTEVHQWMIFHKYKPKAIKRKLIKEVNSVPLRHFVWNIAERFMYKKHYTGDVKANFIRSLFPKEFVDTDIDTTKNFKVSPKASEIPIDEPEGGNLNFHYPEDYTPKQLV